MADLFERAGGQQGTDEAGLPWAGQEPPSVAPVTDRIRRPVPGLPAWDPLPPGEILVVRPTRD